MFTNTVWTERGRYFAVRHSQRLGEVDLDSLQAPEPIPEDRIYPAWNPELTEAPTAQLLNSYLKSVNFHEAAYLEERLVPTSMSSSSAPAVIGEHLVVEAKIYELLAVPGHPNICMYYGAIREGDKLRALCLRKYKWTLAEAMKNGHTLDGASILSDIHAAVNYLHSFGLAHNDLSPANIMLDESGRAVVIDFDACMREGEKLDKCGSEGFCLDDAELSAKENDTYSLECLRKYLMVD